MAELRYAVYLDDPERTGETVVFVPGDEVPEWAAKQITNPNGWVDGKLPTDEEPKRRSTRK
jgi:hypothetical protein